MKQLLKAVYFALRSLVILPLKVAQKPPNPSATYPAILLFRLDRIGDLTLSTPIFRALRAAYPSAHITVMALPGTADVLIGNPHITKVLVYRGFWHALRTLRGRWDLIIDLQQDYYLTPALLTRLLAPRVSIGYALEGRGKLYTAPVVPLPGKKHFVEQLYALIAPLGIPYPGRQESFTEVFTDDATAAAVARWRADHGITPATPCIALHPGGFYPTQRWSKTYFAGLITRLAAAHPERRFLLFGNHVEARLLQDIYHALEGPAHEATFIIVDEPLRFALSLIREAQLFIGNNSGLLHLAAAARVPTVSTMGPTIPWVWHPWGPPETNRVLRNDIGCNPCAKGTCATHDCLTSITVESLHAAAEDLLATATSR